MGDQAPHPVWALGMFCPDWGHMAPIPEAEEMGSSNNSTAESPHMETRHWRGVLFPGGLQVREESGGRGGPQAARLPPPG